MQKKIEQFHFDKTMVHFCKGCDVHMFFLEEVLEAVSFLSQKGNQKYKIQWIFEIHIWSIASNKHMIVL